MMASGSGGLSLIRTRYTSKKKLIAFFIVFMILFFIGIWAIVWYNANIDKEKYLCIGARLINPVNEPS